MTVAESDAGALVHLCPMSAWEGVAQDGDYAPDSLADAGFVHLSAPYQVHLPANRLFAGRRDMLLLWIDPGRLTAPVRWEPGVPGDPESMLFPHLYGALPVAAVVRTSYYRPDDNGIFPALGTESGESRRLPTS